MAFSFDKLPRDAKRAAFAAMDRGSGKKAGGSPTSKTSSSAAAGSGSGAAAKRINSAAKKKKAPGGKTGDLNRTVPTDNGGRISLKDAAVLMFGTAGAAARIAKHNARNKRPRK